MMRSSSAGTSGLRRAGGSWRAIQNGFEDHAGGVAAKRQLARGHFVEHRRRKKKDPCARPVPCRAPVPATCRRRCRGCCRGWSVARHRRRRGAGVGAAAGGLFGAATLARPKSRILAWPRLVTKIFAGLMSRWTMPLECAASSPSAISMADVEQVLHLHGRPAMRVLQRLAVQKFHGDEGLCRLLRRCRRWCRCWDGSARRRPGLRGGSAPAPAGLRPLLGQKFQRDEAAEPRVLGLVHHTHAAAAETFKDAVMGQVLANQGRGIIHVGAHLRCRAEIRQRSGRQR